MDYEIKRKPEKPLLRREGDKWKCGDYEAQTAVMAYEYWKFKQFISGGLRKSHCIKLDSV